MMARFCQAASLFALALGWGPAAWAEEAPSKGADQPAAPEIIVTAQFRAQRLQDTPIAISAMGRDLLEKRSATDIVSAAAGAPNVNLSKGQGGFGQFASVFIRGVGQSDIHFAVEPGVGMYVDDVYYGVMSGAVFQLLDTDRVEIARGPQGTLSGKNSIGGSVKLYSRKPSFQPDAFAEVTAGGRNLLSGRAAANFTIVPDRLAMRLSVSGRRRDGFMQRLDYACATGGTATQRTGADCVLGRQGGEAVWSARASLLWTPASGIENVLSFDTTQDQSENPAQKTVFQSPAWAGSAHYITPWGSYTNYETYQSRPTGASPAPAYPMSPNSTLDAKGVSNNLNIDLGGHIRLTSITAYRYSSTSLSAQIDQTPASISDQSWHLLHRQFTQEIRLSGALGAWADWTVGGYYYNATGASEGRVTISGGVAPGGGGINLDTVFHDPVRTRSISGFVHGVIHATGRLNVTLGGRYTDDRKDFTFNRFDPYGNIIPSLASLVNLTRTFQGTRFDYRINADYRLGDAVMAYAQISTGYKGGGINPRPFVASQALPFAPETLTTYEAGLKNTLFDRHLLLNLAGYYSRLKNLQGTLRSCDAISPAPGFPCNQTTNIGDATIKGIEAEATLRDMGGFSADASLGYTGFSYDHVVAISGVAVGMRSVFNPEFTASLGGQYAFDTGKGTITPRIDIRHRSSIYTDAINTPLGHLPALQLVNARLTWDSPQGNWQASVAVTNLFNTFYAEATSLNTVVPYFAGSYILAQPRQWQVSLRRRF
ncbi:TonB-dependent receptor [Novosphingobium humi]|uniref:TonB-dependent receptor n=1 Tax=Novosphingobium humi TaxID=2282397 RepID=UPI0025B27008|nr:TonB-dependent receptor [Novosphingobium humi]WJT00569.1 TonB-dependent receptor [Novosphingobium humi]